MYLNKLVAETVEGTDDQVRFDSAAPVVCVVTSGPRRRATKPRGRRRLDVRRRVVCFVMI